MVNMKGAGRGAAVCACAFGKNGLSILLAYIPAFDRRSRPIHWESEHCRPSGKGVDIFPPIQQSNMAHVIAEQFDAERVRSEEHTSELQSLMRLSYAVFCLKKKTHDHYYLL